MFIWPIGIIWQWESGGLRAIHIYVIDFQEISQGSGFLLHKFWWPLTPHFLTAKWSLWVIWTSLRGYFFCDIFSNWPLSVEVCCCLKSCEHLRYFHIIYASKTLDTRITQINCDITIAIVLCPAACKEDRVGQIKITYSKCNSQVATADKAWSQGIICPVLESDRRNPFNICDCLVSSL